VEQALKANPDLEAAQAALRAARETYLAEKGAFLPTADLGFDASRQKASAALSPPLSTSQLMFNLYNTEVDVGYSPDVFGGLRRQTESLAAQAEAQRFATEATRLTLEANVVAAAIQEASLTDQIKATEAAITDEVEILNVMKREMNLGAPTKAAEPDQGSDRRPDRPPSGSGPRGHGRPGRPDFAGVPAGQPAGQACRAAARYPAG
jgi:outer membrane protein TolC